MAPNPFISTVTSENAVFTKFGLPHRPGPMSLARRMACGGPGSVGCSVGRKKGGWLWTGMTETPRDSTVIRILPQKRDEPWQDTA
jgi:hypothetical protein